MAETIGDDLPSREAAYIAALDVWVAAKAQRMPCRKGSASTQASD